MECFYCGYEVEGERSCPICGADLRQYRRVLVRGQRLYNEGLRRANNRELSSAIENLEASLHCDKHLTDARNLLGLCYYETGEMVLALREWVISKSLQPEDNRVDRYLEQIQKKEGTLERISNTMHKFNQAVRYCKEGNRDLARIQLKRVIDMCPNMVKAHQLLALCQIADGNYKEAAKALNKARKIDASDPVTVRYIEEVRAGLKKLAKEEGRKSRKLPAAFVLGSDEIPLERQRSILDYLDGMRGSFLNITVGMVIGILVMIFLVNPAIRARSNSQNASALINANQEREAAGSSISSLQSQVEDLKSQLSAYTGKDDVSSSYENLLLAMTRMTARDQQGANEALSTINRELLGNAGKSQYDELSRNLTSYRQQSALTAGNTAFNASRWQDAVNQFLAIVNEEAGYQDGIALYRLAVSYNRLGDRDNAIKYYEQLLSSLANSRYRNAARRELTQLGVTVNADNSFTDTQASQQGQSSSNDAEQIQRENAQLQTR